MQQNLNTMVSRVTRELESISSMSDNKHSPDINSIKTTLILATKMLESGTKYCLRMTCRQSDSIFVTPGGYKMHIRYRKDSHVNYDPEYVNVDVSSYKKSVHMYLESGENDERLRWPMFGMTFTLEAPDKIKVATITVCTNCKGQNLNRVLGGVYREREIAFADIKSLIAMDPTHVYILFEYHFCT